MTPPTQIRSATRSYELALLSAACVKYACSLSCGRFSERGTTLVCQSSHARTTQIAAESVSATRATVLRERVGNLRGRRSPFERARVRVRTRDEEGVRVQLRVVTQRVCREIAQTPRRRTARKCVEPHQ